MSRFVRKVLTSDAFQLMAWSILAPVSTFLLTMVEIGEEPQAFYLVSSALALLFTASTAALIVRRGLILRKDEAGLRKEPLENSRLSRFLRVSKTLFAAYAVAVGVSLVAIVLMVVTGQADHVVRVFDPIVGIILTALSLPVVWKYLD